VQNTRCVIFQMTLTQLLTPNFKNSVFTLTKHYSHRGSASNTGIPVYRYTENRDTGQIGTVYNTGIDTWNTGICGIDVEASHQFVAVLIDLFVYNSRNYTRQPSRCTDSPSKVYCCYNLAVAVGLLTRVTDACTLITACNSISTPDFW